MARDRQKSASATRDEREIHGQPRFSSRRARQKPGFSVRHYLLRLAGRIRYAIAVEPVVGRRMMDKLQIIFPKLLEMEQMVTPSQLK
jgi:hypothetical protein